MRSKLLPFIALCGTLSLAWPCRAASLQHRVIYSRTYDARRIAVPPSAFSHDGKLFATTALVGDSATLRLWNTRTAKLIRAFSIPNLQFFTFSPDSQSLAVITGVRGRYGVDTPYSVQLRNVRSGSLIRMLVKAGAVHTAFYTVAFSPDGKLIAAGSGDGMARVWSAKSGRRVAILRQGGFVESLSFAPNGQTLATSRSDYGGGIKLWTVATGKLLHSVTLNGNNATLTFSPNGKRLVVNGSDRRVQLYDVSNLKLLRQLSSSQDWRQENSTPQVALSSNGKQVAFTRDGFITVRDAVNPTRVFARYAIGEDTGPVTNGVLTLHFAPSSRELSWATYTYKDDSYSLTLWRARL